MLFFAEAATLAHVARPMVLAQALESAGYCVEFAADSRYQALFAPLSRPWHPLHSISTRDFLQALARGSPLYSEAQLNAYVEEDLRLIDQVKPDLVVGDFRLSLSVSARLPGVPYWTLTNAYWSPYASPHYRVPELPITRVLGVTAADRLFRWIRPLAFALHTRPLNRVRRAHGLASLGLDLRRTYTDADCTLYADLPQLAPTFELPGNHHYLGPIIWSPQIPLPPWWQDLPEHQPVIYVTLGSSGEKALLPSVLAALAKLPVTVIAATMGETLESPGPSVFLTDYLPGETAAARSQLVICNGGSPTTYQALAQGVPVIGIAGNLDQYLNMGYLEQTGVGRLLRAGQLTATSLTACARAVLDDATMRERALSTQASIAHTPPGERFIGLLQDAAVSNGTDS
ncbi:glycosyltransferase [Motiliproteus sp. SC1-56]|uniref:glycosyltransferase n=1 Tax=Motiliproteus sp. SC1-56 TaxID=2799565 RepID=UPI00351CA26A